MKITSYRLFNYCLPLSLSKMKERKGIILALETACGKICFSEAAPLPRFSKETYQETLSALQELKTTVLETDWTEESCLPQLSPSATFALESALRYLLNPQECAPIPLCALLMGSEEQIRRRAALAKKQGITCAKLKIAQLSHNIAESLIEELSRDFLLRLDFNTQTHGDLEFSKSCLDYIEEPNSDYPNCNIAVDERLRTHTLEQLTQIKQLNALIIKPSIQPGGMQGMLELKKYAEEKNLRFVLSSSFESQIGLFHLTQLYHRLQIPALPMGFDTLSYFEESLLEENFEIANGKLIPPTQLKPKWNLLDALPC